MQKSVVSENRARDMLLIDQTAVYGLRLIINEFSSVSVNQVKRN